MKSLIRILLACLISSTSFACGWYPFGEDVRFSLMSPEIFDDGGMSPYYYTSQNYGYGFQSSSENDPNVALWKEYCKGKVDEESIFEAVYELEKYKIERGSTENKMVLYLKRNDKEALSYLVFAKSCSHLNNVYSDWEREDEEVSRNRKMLEALNRSKGVKSKAIKRRYHFLALRLAFYNNDSDKARRIFEKSFSGTPTDIIDYWALYFNSAMQKKSAERNFNMAQVFVNAPGKRFGALSKISINFPIDEVLAFAKTDKERANVNAVYAVRNRGRGLSDLKAVWALDPQNPMLDFMLIREVNKIEDWVLTPRYTNFDPTMDPRGSRYGETNELIQERIEDDEKYAGELSDWLESLAETSQKWKLVEAYLKGITGNEREALMIMSSSHLFPEETRNLVKQLRILFRVRFSKNQRVELNANDHAVLMAVKQDNYNQFLFAVSREFEFQNKLDIAAALFSHVNRSTDFYSGGVSWKSGTGKATLDDDYYYSWFLYLDAEYSPEEVQSVIDFAELKFTESTEFDRWQREYLGKNLDRLYDLLGTKYVRQNNMDMAIAAFENVGGELWSKYPFKNYLNGNPFHADFYSGHKPSKMDTILFTKLELVKQYKVFKEKAENPKTKNRAYYYFLLANCELNMSHYGNSWMMRRYFWTRSMHANYLEDDDEFFRLKRAKEFYQLAYDLTSDSKVKALCLRMKGRCERHQLSFDAPDSWDFDYDKVGGFSNYIYSQNKSYNKLKKDYPDDAEELMSNCFSFERYFAKLEH